MMQTVDRGRDSAEEAGEGVRSEASSPGVASQSVLLGRVRHDLRTPVNAIIGYSEMLLEDAEDLGREGVTPRLQEIHAAGKRLLSLINELLDAETIEASQGSLDLSE